MSIIEFKMDNEGLIKTYKNFKRIWKEIRITEYDELENLEKTKCFFGRGSYPSFIRSWEAKINALLYDVFIFDISTFLHVVIGGLSPDLDDENEILKYYPAIDLEASNIFIELYKNQSIKLVDSTSNDVFNRDEYRELEEENKLYSKKSEIDEICRKAAFPGDEYNIPGLLGFINYDIVGSYLTNSSIITKEYACYIKRKLNDYNKIEYKHDIINLLLEYEVPNFASLDFNKINSIRNSSSLFSLRKRIGESTQDLAENKLDIKEIVQNLRDELWELALNNISDSYSNVIVENLISNVPVVSAFISARDIIEIRNLRNHWGYTILNLKKNK